MFSQNDPWHDKMLGFLATWLFSALQSHELLITINVDQDLVGLYAQCCNVMTLTDIDESENKGHT